MAYTTGRPSIFPDKDGRRFQGSLTVAGTAEFEARRELLSTLSGIARVSDSDVVESFVRGMPATNRAIARMAVKG